MNLDLMEFIMNLPNQIKDGAYVINLDEYSDIGTHWIALYALTSNMYPNLNDQQQFRLNKTNEVNDFFIAKIRERELISKSPSKYIASFDCFDKSLIDLSVTSGGIFIAKFLLLLVHL